jgi:hypothetical protein
MENDEAMRGIEGPDYCEEVRQLADEDAAKARDMLSEYFWTSMTSASGGELTQLILHLSLFVWFLCPLVAHSYHSASV